MHAAHLCSTNQKMSKCKGRNSEAYSNLLPVFHFTLVFKGLFYTLIAMCSLNGRDISKISQDRFKHNFARMHNQIDEKHGESRVLARCTIERRCKQRNGPLLGHGLDISQLRLFSRPLILWVVSS